MGGRGEDDHRCPICMYSHKQETLLEPVIVL